MNFISRRSFLPMLGSAIVAASCLSVQSDEQSEQSNKKRPPKLKKGSVIGIAASAGGIKNESEIAKFSKVLRDLGFGVKLGTCVAGRYGYFSATDQERADEFMNLISDDDVDAIFFIRGGWGCARILDYLDFNRIQQHPKVIMGFSDMTTLLNAITAKTGLITFHGPGGNSTWNEYSIRYIRELIMKGNEVVYENQSEDHPIKTLVGGVAEGELVGGNLSVLSGLIGSDYLPSWNGKLLFLEDVGEEPYRIDRMLTHLDLAGVFDQVSGVILGNFRKCEPEEKDRSFSLEEVFDHHFNNRSIPVFWGAQIGHIRNKFTVPVGALARMDANKGSLQLLHSAVE